MLRRPKLSRDPTSPDLNRLSGIRSKIRKAVIPAAGLGTRLLPATKAVPKEMLPIAGRPLIQFAVEEAISAGLDTVVLVVSEAKSLVAQHFSRDLALEKTLRTSGKEQEAELVRSLAQFADVHTVCQEVPLGLADAIRKARPIVGSDPFAVLLPDAIIDSAVPVIKQLLSCHQQHPGCIIGTQRVLHSEVSRCGILDVVPLDDGNADGRSFRVTSLAERPEPDSTTSDYAILGRYILEPAIFDYIDSLQPGFGGELQLTDALQLYSQKMPVYAYHFEGKHYDVGSKLGLVQATLAYSLKDSELACPLIEYLATLESFQPQTEN